MGSIVLCANLVTPDSIAGSVCSSPSSVTMRFASWHWLCQVAFLAVLPSALSLPRPGMLIWNCQGCPYPTKTHHADVELSGPSGNVGNLVVTHMIPEGGVGQNVEIENVNTRVSFENLQKQRNFDVRIHEGTCENLGEKIHSVRCSNCQNSLAVKIMGSQKTLHIKGDGSEGDLIGKVVLFYDRQRGSKLACGLVNKREQ